MKPKPDIWENLMEEGRNAVLLRIPPPLFQEKMSDRRWERQLNFFDFSLRQAVKELAGWNPKKWDDEEIEDALITWFENAVNGICLAWRISQISKIDGVVAARMVIVYLGNLAEHAERFRPIQQARVLDNWRKALGPNVAKCVWFLSHEFKNSKKWGFPEWETLAKEMEPAICSLKLFL